MTGAMKSGGAIISPAEAPAAAPAAPPRPLSRLEKLRLEAAEARAAQK